MRNATSGAERVRQTIEATSFKIDGENVELTASCAVAEMGKTESLTDFFQRLQTALALAKKAGRNRTCADEGNGPNVVELSQYRVKGRVIDVADEA